MVIVRVGYRSITKMMTEGSRRFRSVLESVSATGVVTAPFIIWQGESHRESYYSEGGLLNEATFAVSESDYMDDEMSFEYMKENFKLDTRYDPPASRCLIVEGYSSHIS